MSILDKAEGKNWDDYKVEYPQLLKELRNPLLKLRKQYSPADTYNEADGTRTSKRPAEIHYHQLIDLALDGHPKYLLDIAGNLYLGEFMPKDEVLGLKIFQDLIAIKKTKVLAIFRLANCYHSQGKWQNLPGKLENFFEMIKELADEDGHLPAVFRTGANYLMGRGTEKNRDLAYQYLKKAEERGHILAIRFIAWYYWESKNILHKLKAAPIMLRYMYLYNREYRRGNLDDDRVCG